MLWEEFYFLEWWWGRDKEKKPRNGMARCVSQRDPKAARRRLGPRELEHYKGT